MRKPCLTVRRQAVDKWVRRICWAVVLMLGTGACTFQGALQEQFYATPDQGRKIPLKVALVIDEHFRAQRLVAENLVGSGRKIDIALHPALSDAIKGLFATLFEAVSVVDSAEQAREADFVVIPSSNILAEQPVKVALSFHDPNALPTVVAYEATESVDWRAGEGKIIALTALQTISLHTLTPLTMLAETKIRGGNVIEQVQAALSKSLSVIASKIRNDQMKLVAYARRERPAYCPP